MEDEPCMEGSDDEYDDLVDTSNNTDSYFDESDENMSMSSAPTDSIFTSPSTSHVTDDTQLAQDSNNLLPSTPTAQQNPSHIQLQTSTPVPTNTLPSTLASLSNQPLTTHWSTNLHPVILNPFSGTSGPTFTVTENPIDVFRHFFTCELIDTIVQQTNLYAKQIMTPAAYTEWDKITVCELEAYFGFCILMSINHLPAIDDYWRKDDFLRYHPIADRITRARFREITRYLHFVDNSQLPKKGEHNYDRLGKVRPIMKFCQEKFLSNFEPHCEQAVDEAMIPFQGRSSIKQYMPLKPTKRGFKVWVRGDSPTGYFCEFDVYEGQADSTSDSSDVQGAKVVKKHTRRIVGKFHHVFFDNFFSSTKLVQDLLDDDIYSCGTVHTDRKGWPLDLKKKTKTHLKNVLHMKKRFVYI